MKARSEIMGLCIVNIQTADEIGKIKDVLVDPTSKGIAYYVLAEPSDYFGARLINQKHAVGLGGFALTVSGEEIIEDVAHCPQAIALLRGNIQVIGTYALSDKGVLLGTVKQMFFDETTGEIVRYRIENEENRVFDLDGSDVVTLGSNFTIFLDDSELIDVDKVEAASYAWADDEEDQANPDEREEESEQDPYEELADIQEENGYMDSEMSKDVLKVAARPLSAAEMALVKAAESLRQKYAAEALRAQGLDVRGHSAEQISAQAAAKKLARTERAAREIRSEKTEISKRIGEASQIAGSDKTDRKAPYGRIENKTISAKTEKAEGIGLPCHDEEANSPETSGGRERAAEKEREGAREGAGADRKTLESKTIDNKTAPRAFPQAQEKGSLSANELIYPKDFNLFDRRQMQFLLGKRLVQAVRLENGETMEEGEYISAEMLSRVRSRSTLMELTAHVRKA